VAVVREGGSVRVYLNGTTEITGDVPAKPGTDLVLGGRADAGDTLEGKLDEVSVYRRPLSSAEIARRYALVSGSAEPIGRRH
jgi:hypothetical protein